MTVATDEDLMQAFQRGDAQAFAALVERHEQRLWQFLRRYVGDDAAAEDLLQDVFLRIVDHAASWKRSAKFTTWMFSIARNLCTDQARRVAVRRAVSLDAEAAPSESGSAPALVERIPGSDPGAEARLSQGRLGVQIDMAVAALPDEQREVFLMREVMEMSFAEIAAAVGASEPTVKSRMRYALQRLRTALAPFADVPAPATATEGGAA